MFNQLLVPANRYTSNIRRLFFFLLWNFGQVPLAKKTIIDYEPTQQTSETNICSKLIIETLEIGVSHVQSKQ